MHALSRNQIRQIDIDAVKELGLPSLLLMENAARGVEIAVIQSGPWRSITILCGPGNNGGDGLAVARLLASSGTNANILLIRGNKPLSKDAAANHGFLTRAGIPVEEPGIAEVTKSLSALQRDDLIIDALLGTGVHGIVDSPFSEIISFANQSAASILAVDVPSGLDCDAGSPCGVAVRAHSTVTFVARKCGFLNPASSEYTGAITVCHIGIPQVWLDSWFRGISQQPKTSDDNPE